jgi:intracellular sulfur oxidation DsrE/DsrF family protein
VTSRRTFIAAGAAVAAAAPALAAEAAEVDPERTAAPFDLPALMARLNEPARHKQLFAVAHVNDGAVISYMRNSLDAYERGFGEGPGSLRVAAVFYGRGVALALDDAAWRKYKLSALLRHSGESIMREGQDVNPYYRSAGGANSLEALARGGALYMACNNALKGLAVLAGSADGAAPADDIHADLRAHLIPGAILVPAGVAAINAAQEARFTFFEATT